MSTTGADVSALDAEVRHFLELRERADDLGREMSASADRIRSFGIGKHSTSYGVKVAISPPNQRFNVARAVEMIPAPLRAECLVTDYDARLVKAHLTQAQLEAAMDPGTGSLRVTVS